MSPNEPQRRRMQDPKNKPSQTLMILIAVGVAVVVTILGQAILYVAELFRAKPLG